MDTNRLKRFATEARNILMQGVVHRLSALGFLPDGSVTEEPQQQGGGATFMGDTVTQDFYDKWQSLRRAVTERSMAEVAEEAAYTWFNRLVAIRILVKNGLASPVLEYESEEVLVPLLVSEARQGRMPEMDADSMRKLTELLDDDSKTNEQFALLIVAYCHENPIINKCFGRISDYTELLLPTNILTEGGFVYLLNHTEFIAEEDFRSPELIGWLYQFYISEKKDDVFASFKKGKKAEAKDIPAATQIFTPNWIVKYMVQNTVGRIYLDNNPYSDIKDSMQYLVEPEEPTPTDAIFRFDDIHDLTCADLACGSGHILNECFDLLYQLYIEEGYSRKNAIEDIFKYNLTGVDLDTRAKQLAQFALLLKACQKDPSFADAHCMPKVLDMPKVDKYTYVDTCGHFDCAYGLSSNQKIHEELADAFMLMSDAENLGSIMKLEISDSTRDYMIKCIESYDDKPQFDNAFSSLLHGYSLILTLTKKYAALVANPPYMGSGNMNANLSQYVKDNYSTTKQDLYSIFMKMMLDKTILNGKCGFVTMETWMFISSFESFREYLLDNYTIESLVHMPYLGKGWTPMGISFGTSATVISNYSSDISANYQFIRYYEMNKETGLPFNFPTVNERYKKIKQSSFRQIPGFPIGYWLSGEFISNFSKGTPLSSLGQTTKGLITGDNSRFLRLWWEVTNNKTNFSAISEEDAKLSKLKWFPCNKGGNARNWYGNNEYVINWFNSGYEVIEKAKEEKRHAQDYYDNIKFQQVISWSSLSSGRPSFRFKSNDLVDHAGMAFYPDKCDKIYQYLGFMASNVGRTYLALLSPTINFNAGEIGRLPIVASSDERIVNKIVKNNISLSKQDWDAHETSWDFETNPLLAVDEETYIDNIHHEIERHEKETGEHICIDPAAPELDSLEWRMEQYKQKWEHLFMQLHENEEELNRQFIDIYGLQDELTPDVPLDEITILQQGEVSIE